MPLPAQIDPRKLALASSELAGELPANRLCRLASAEVSIKEPARAIIAFNIDESGFTLMTGSVSLQAAAQCQRCLNDVDICIESEFTLTVMSKENECLWNDKLIDPLIMEKGTLNLHHLLEDELILALPIVSHHETGQCTNNLYKLTNSSNSSVKKGPFDILSQLKI